MYNRTFSDLSLPHFLFPSGVGGGERGVGGEGGQGRGRRNGGGGSEGGVSNGKKAQRPQFTTRFMASQREIMNLVFTASLLLPPRHLITASSVGNTM